VVAQEYEIETQAQIISALVVLHNFIHIHDPDDLIDGDEPNNQPEVTNQGNLQRSITAEERAMAANHRDTIVNEMWRDYLRSKGQA
jgi:hypothetical protein